jgi:hypothetical protein
MKRYIVVAVMLISMVVVATPAYAANYICSGNVTFIGLAANGDVAVAGPGGLPVAVLICNMNTTTSNGFTPDSCKTAYATLLAARLAGQPASIYFQDSLTCATQPMWTGYALAYFVNV